MKTYRTRFSLLLVAIIIGVSLVLIIPVSEAVSSGKASEVYKSLGIVLLYYLISLGALFTSYTIDPQRQQLIVTNFFGLAKSRFDIMKMIRVRNTSSIMSAPASSLKRICIESEGKASKRLLVISPVMQEEFLNELKKVNPAIEDQTHQ